MFYFPHFQVTPDSITSHPLDKLSDFVGYLDWNVVWDTSSNYSPNYNHLQN